MSTLSSLACYDVFMEEKLVEFGRWLENEIDRRDWKQADFAREGKFKPQNVSRWIKGAVQPSYDSARQIARTLGVTTDEVLIRTGHRDVENPEPIVRSPVEQLRSLLHQMPITVPVYDQPVSAGKGEPSIQQYLYFSPDTGIPPSWYGLPVIGSCMVPHLFEGDVVVVDPEGIAEPGDMVVAEIDHERALVKWFTKHRGNLFIEPERGDAVPYDEERVRIVGVVMKMWRDVRKKPRKEIMHAAEA